MSKLIATCIVSGALLSLASVTAQAEIVCRGGYQVSGGQEIATPYCQDAALAASARKHGDEVSNKAIRDNAGVKDSACEFLGNSPAAGSDCPDSDYGDE